MSPLETDALEAWSARVADGESIDWQAARRELSHEAFTQLRHLADLAGVMRAGSSSADEEQVPGERWGHLELRGMLGQGSYGKVMRAYDPILQREVALKLRRASASDGDPGAWIREARQMARVRHPNVLAVHGADTHAGVPGLWADRVEGQTLRQRINASLPDSAEWLRIAQQLTAAVRAVHEEGLVHGDIKPGNVMLEAPSGRAILMDFGTAHEVEAADDVLRSTGTPMYMAPERHTGRAATPASDVFALGATLVSLASGRLPFQAESIERLREQQRQGGGLDLEGVILPKPFRRLMTKMLDPDPIERPTIDAVAERLELLRTAPARRRRALAVSSIIVLLAVGLAVAATAYVRVRNAESETSAVNDLLRDVLAAPRATELGREARVVDVLERAVPEAERRFADRPLVLARVRALAGRTLESLGLLDLAETQLLAALEVYEAKFGPDHRRTVELLDPIARVFNRTGRRAQAEALWQSSLLRSDTTSWQGRNDRMYAHIGLARLRMEENAFDVALAELDRAMAMHIDQRTERAAQSVEAMQTLVLYQAGRLEEAAEIGARSLEDSLRVNGRRHVNTLIARDRLLQVRLGRGDMEAAERLARENLAETLEWLGEGELRTVMAQISLSNVLADRGQLDESLRWLDAASAGAPEAFGQDATAPLEIDNNRAARLLELGRFSEAATLAEALARRFESSQAPTGILPWINALNLAEARYWLDDYEASLAQSERTHREVVAAHGPAHPLARVAESYRGAALNSLGRTDEAAPLLEAAHSALSDLMGPDHPQVLLVDAWRAEHEALSGRAEAGAAALDLVRTRAEQVLEPGHYRLRDLERIADRLNHAEGP